MVSAENPPPGQSERNVDPERFLQFLKERYQGKIPSMDETMMQQAIQEFHAREAGLRGAQAEVESTSGPVIAENLTVIQKELWAGKIKRGLTDEEKDRLILAGWSYRQWDTMVPYYFDPEKHGRLTEEEFRMLCEIEDRAAELINTHKCGALVPHVLMIFREAQDRPLNPAN